MNTYNKGTHASYIYNLLGSGQGLAPLPEAKD